MKFLQVEKHEDETDRDCYATSSIAILLRNMCRRSRIMCPVVAISLALLRIGIMLIELVVAVLLSLCLVMMLLVMIRGSIGSH